MQTKTIKTFYEDLFVEQLHEAKVIQEITKNIKDQTNFGVTIQIYDPEYPGYISIFCVVLSGSDTDDNLTHFVVYKSEEDYNNTTPIINLPIADTGYPYIDRAIYDILDILYDLKINIIMDNE